MGIDLNGNKIYSTSIGPEGEAIKRIITDNLVFHVDAGNKNSYGGSGLTWYDLSGNAYNSTLNNTPTYSSNNNGYLIFNGSNQNVTIPTASMPTGNLITFCVWNYGITAQQSSVIECRDVNGARTINVHLPWSDGNIYFDCGGDRLYQAAGSTYLGWNYWCFTKNASTGNMVIYRNGTSWASSVGNVGTINTTTASRLCSYAIDTTYHNAYLSNVKIYSRELSATQVKQNFNAQKSRFGL